MLYMSQIKLFDAFKNSFGNSGVSGHILHCFGEQLCGHYGLALTMRHDYIVVIVFYRSVSNDKRKAKKQLELVAAGKGNALGVLMDSSKSGTGVDLHEDESWVIVKKQRITILIPPLSVPKEHKHQNLKINQKRKSRRTVKSRPKVPTETFSQKCEGSEPKKSVAPPSDKAISDVAICANQLNAATKKLPNSTFGTSAECPDHNIGNSMLQLPSTEWKHKKQLLSTCISRKAVGVSSISKIIKQPGLICSVRGYKPFHGSICCVDGATFLNKRMRAANLERELNRVGGLNVWLISLGLGQFVPIFKGRIINKFHLVNLTMNKLKYMGADAVGPRRKLIHAINCISEPYYFKTV